MSRHDPVSLEGWRLLKKLMIAITVLTVATLAIYSFEVAGIRAAIRLTARASLLLFLAAFLASALHGMFANEFTGWLRRNRRQFGLGFAYSHLVHAIAIVAFWQLDPATFLIGRTPGSYIPGALGYAFIIAMAVTSFDRTAKAVGPRTWKLIHSIGGWYVFIQFCVSFGKRIGAMPSYTGFLMILLLALCVRLSAFATKLRKLLRERKLSAGSAECAAVHSFP